MNDNRQISCLKYALRMRPETLEKFPSGIANNVFISAYRAEGFKVEVSGFQRFLREGVLTIRKATEFSDTFFNQFNLHFAPQELVGNMPDPTLTEEQIKERIKQELTSR